MQGVIPIHFIFVTSYLALLVLFVILVAGFKCHKDSELVKSYTGKRLG